MISYDEWDEDSDEDLDEEQQSDQDAYSNEDSNEDDDDIDEEKQKEEIPTQVCIKPVQNVEQAKINVDQQGSEILRISE